MEERRVVGVGVIFLERLCKECHYYKSIFNCFGFGVSGFGFRVSDFGFSRIMVNLF